MELRRITMLPPTVAIKYLLCFIMATLALLLGSMPIKAQQPTAYTCDSQIGNGAFYTFAVNPTQPVIAIGHAGGIKLYDEAFRFVDSLSDPIGPIYALAWSNNGQHIAATYAAEDKNFTRVWHVQSKMVLLTIEQPAKFELYPLAWSGNDEKIVLSQQNQMQIWDIASGQMVSSFQATPSAIDSVNIVLWLPNSKIVTVSNFQLQVWDANDGHNLAVIRQNEPIYAVSSQPNTPTITFTLAGSQQLWQWNWQTNAVTPSLPAVVSLDSEPDALAWHGHKLAIALGQQLVIWDTATQQSTVFSDFVGNIDKLVWNTNGTKIYASTSAGKLQIWDANTTDKISEYKNIVGNFASVAWASVGDDLAISNENEISLWNIGNTF
jgi:WD40 repeat protein